MPKQSEIEAPLLKCLEEMKDQGRPLEVDTLFAEGWKPMMTLPDGRIEMKTS